jgi:hypothetical protein
MCASIRLGGWTAGAKGAKEEKKFLRRRGHDSTVFDAEARIRRELAEVGFTEMGGDPETRNQNDELGKGCGVRGDAGSEII